MSHFLKTCNSTVEVFLRVAGFFFGKNDDPSFSRTCNSPVEVFLRAAGAFFSVKMTFLVFLRHVIALLGSSHVPQAFSPPQKWHSWDLYDM